MADQPRPRTHLTETNAWGDPPDERKFPLVTVLAGLLAILDIASAIGMLMGQA